jgi:hypothetical protein
MQKTKIIKVGTATHRWLKLMLHLYNAPAAVHHCVFSEADAACDAANRMRHVVTEHPTWCPMTIMQRGCNVWIIKNDHIQKVVITDE